MDEQLGPSPWSSCPINSLPDDVVYLMQYREAAEKEAAQARYWKLHQEGKTDQAKADMARLAVIRKKREEAAAQRLAEAQGKIFGPKEYCVLRFLISLCFVILVG